MNSLSYIATPSNCVKFVKVFVDVKLDAIDLKKYDDKVLYERLERFIKKQ